MSFVFFLPILPKKQIDELRKSKSTMGRAQADREQQRVGFALAQQASTKSAGAGPHKIYGSQGALPKSSIVHV